MNTYNSNKIEKYIKIMLKLLKNRQKELIKCPVTGKNL
jgi:hypothetical protein